MINWLKYFFGAFFLHKKSKENEKRNLLNAVLAVALSFVLFLTGMYAGYVASFPTHLNKSSQFEKTVTQVFGAGGVNLVVKNGVATSVDNSRPVDTMSGVGTSVDTGMQVVVDTTPTAKNFSEFTVSCVLKTDEKKEITYSEYLELKKDEQSKYSVSVKNLGTPLAIDEEKIQTYNEHLQAASDKSNSFYNVGIAADYTALDKSDPDYASKLYELYVASYYPFMSKFERYAAAPSMKTYYTQQIEKADYYLIILDDMCLGRFATDKGVDVEFSGFFSNVENCSLNGNAQSDNQLLKSAKNLISNAFSAGTTNVMSVYVINAISSFPIVVVAEFLIAVAMWFAIKKCHGDYGFGASIKTVFLYFFVASLVVFVLSLTLSFAISREAVYTVAVVGLFAAVLVRSAVFCVTECMRSLKNYRAERPADKDAPADSPIE